MDELRNITEESVDYLFKELKIKKIPIVVLRNYQNLPDIGSDLDAALQRQDISVIREIFTSDFYRDRWSEICEVKTHNSKIDEQNIFIFKFFNRELNEYMQLDFFQGFLFKGQPFFTIKDMLHNTRTVNGYPVVNVDIELKIKYFQILSAMQNNQISRVDKYTNQAILLENLPANSKDLNFVELNNYLKNKEFYAFQEQLKSYRRDKLQQIFLQNPLAFFRNIFYRFGSFYSFFISNPFVVKCQISSELNMELLRNVLDDLVEQKCFRGYYIASEETLKSKIKKYKYLSQGGGIIVNLNKNGYYSSDKGDLQRYIINCFVQNHTSLY